MRLSETMSEEEIAVFDGFLRTMEFPEGSRIVEQGSPGDGCFIIDKGRVRLELDLAETDIDAVLGYVEQGALLGEFSLLDHQPRSAHAIADTHVSARFLSARSFQTICDKHPQVGVKIMAGLGGEVAGKIRQMNDRMSGFLVPDKVDPDVDEMVGAAVLAQEQFAGWNEKRVDEVLGAIADTIAESAQQYAQATVEETGMGVVEHKVAKIRFASLDVCQALRERRAAGLLRFHGDRKVQEIAAPMGVIFGLIPVTNPVPTIVFKTLVSLKSRNALILSCHRKALGVCNAAGEVIQKVLDEHGAPRNLVQWVRERGSRRKTAMYMTHPHISLILATGGPSLVRAAYSSGKPAIGVGMGNAPTLVCSDADPDTAAKMAVDSKSFDNGIICGSDNNLVVVRSVREAFVKALQEHGAAILQPQEVTRLVAALFDPKSNHVRPDSVGLGASVLAERAGIVREESFRLLVAPVRKTRLDSPCACEKLAPILSLIEVDDEDEGIKVCAQILSKEGAGHTAIVHTNDKDVTNRFALAMPASRILVNTPGTQGCIGMGNGLNPSFTLGCGTFSGSSTTDNVSFDSLFNLKRLAYPLR